MGTALFCAQKRGAGIRHRWGRGEGILWIICSSSFTDSKPGFVLRTAGFRLSRISIGKGAERIQDEVGRISPDIITVYEDFLNWRRDLTAKFPANYGLFSSLMIVESL